MGPVGKLEFADHLASFTLATRASWRKSGTRSASGLEVMEDVEDNSETLCTRALARDGSSLEGKS